MSCYARPYVGNDGDRRHRVEERCCEMGNGAIPPAHARVLQLAHSAYLGEDTKNWGTMTGELASFVACMKNIIGELALRPCPTTHTGAFRPTPDE